MTRFEKWRQQARNVKTLANMLEREVTLDCERADAVMAREDDRERLASINRVMARQVFSDFSVEF